MNWVALITSLLGPMLAKCFQEQSSEEPQAYLARHYDATASKMDADLVRDAMPATARAVRKAHRQCRTKEDRKSFPRYSRDELYALTEDRLITAMKADPTEVASAYAAAASMTEDD